MPGANNPIPLRVNQQAVIHVVRTSIAAVASLLVARLFRLPEAYWAAITTLVVMQSSLGAALTVSWQRFVGSAIGAAAGALFATYFGSNTAMFGIGIFVMGIVCAALRLDKAAYRFAGITLAIIMLIAHTAPAWIVAVHRFIEVAVGIAVGLALTAVWPEDPAAFDAHAS
ncbi:MAG: FUSC family protein [Candidatus Acidiferrales bacterium]|jgi:uncharacterized membrane protein YgaE (UPF0421/DUF939 family)